MEAEDIQGWFFADSVVSTQGECHVDHRDD